VKIFIVPGSSRVEMRRLREEIRFARTEIHESVEGLSYLGELFALSETDARFISEELGVEVRVGFPTPGDYLFFWDRDTGPVYEVF